jgi:putative NADPH-quinone reductase
MKTLVINGSPMMDKGNTALILGPFIEGMKEAGSDVEVLYVKKLVINPCQGEYNCWLKTPGECFQDDDMKDVLKKFHACDILVFAAPVYVDGVPGPLKMLIDRLIPSGVPFIECRDDHCRHAGRMGMKKISRFALVSNCGFWEMDNFDPMVVHMKAFCRNIRADFCGALLRPHGGALRAMMQMGGIVDDIFEAAKDAGRQIVQNGPISEENLKIIGKELVPRDMYIEYANQYFTEVLDKLSHG